MTVEYSKTVFIYISKISPINGSLEDLKDAELETLYTVKYVDKNQLRESSFLKDILKEENIYNFVATNHLKNIRNYPLEWRVPLGLQMIPSLILAISILFCPFSPCWLISHDREDEARNVLKKIRSASDDEIEEEINRIRNEVAYLREYEIESYRQLFRFQLRRPFILGNWNSNTSTINWN